jgi:hypothetical protein
MINSSIRGEKVIVNMHTFDEDIYVLSDNPILFKSPPSTHSEIGHNDFVFPVSSKRLYSSSKDALNTFPTRNAYLYNAAAIQQATNRVVSGNLEVLKNSVNLFKDLGKRNLLNEIPSFIFTCN